MGLDPTDAHLEGSVASGTAGRDGRGLRDLMPWDPGFASLREPSDARRGHRSRSALERVARLSTPRGARAAAPADRPAPAPPRRRIPRASSSCRGSAARPHASARAKWRGWSSAASIRATRWTRATSSCPRPRK
jgi:hypothetical protein